MDVMNPLQKRRTPWNSVSVRRRDSGGFAFAMWNEQGMYTGEPVLALSIDAFKTMTEASKAAGKFAEKNNCVHYGF